MPYYSDEKMKEILRWFARFETLIRCSDDLVGSGHWSEYYRMMINEVSIAKHFIIDMMGVEGNTGDDHDIPF